MELYIIRHGQSTNNALEGDWQRTYDPALTTLGKKQAAALAEHLAHGAAGNKDEAADRAERSNGKGGGITRLFCSPMHRALQTTAPVSRMLGIDPEVRVDIYEHGGIYLENGEGIVGYPGKTRPEILAEFPNYILPEGVTDAGWWTGTQESYSECQERAQGFARQLHAWAMGEYHAERIAIITHGTFTDCLLKALLNLTHADHCYYGHNNTAVTRLDFVRENLILVRYMNRVDHLTPDMIS